MRKPALLLALFLVLLSVALHAQSVLTIPPSHCVWRAGDDLSWAAPSLDESGWKPYSSWALNPNQLRIWVRCHADLTSLSGTIHPAIQVSLYAAYQLYLDGNLFAAEGNLRRGNFSIDAIRTFPLNTSLRSPGPSTLALRITLRSLVSNSGPIRGLLKSRLEIRAGDEPLLAALRARTALARSLQYSDTALCYGIIGVMAVMLLGLYLFDRGRIELLLLSITCLSLAILRLNEFATAALLNYSFNSCLALVLVANLALTAAQVLFFFALAGRRMPRLFWILLAVTLLFYAPSAVGVLLAASQPAWLVPLNSVFLRPVDLAGHMAMALAPFVVFFPYAQIARRMRPLAALCMLWQIADFIWFAVEATDIPLPGVPNLFAHWGLALLDVRAFTTAGVLAALLGLLFREQRQVTEERATLAGEMLAAQQVQRMLAPAAFDVLPGVRIEVAFRPIREVGGDFYASARLPGNRQRILIGDVSGKGAAAAMTAAVLVGAARRRENESPAALLEHLNLVLGDMNLGGFATCLCADLSADGCLTLANAGHLAPYRSGHEVPVESGLPLGIVPETGYAESSIRLAPGDSLTFVSDGVVEAQSSTGELFGFDRTRELSTQSAQQIAQAAQAFGQEDDITVLTLAFEGAGAYLA